MKKTKNNTGFTLVELLVVITVISILASFILPAIKSAREAAVSSVCQGYLKQFGYALLMYTNEWNGYVPEAFLSGDIGWQDALQPYTKGVPFSSGQNPVGVYSCPSGNPEKNPLHPTWANWNYMMNECVELYRIDNIPLVTDKVFVCDGWYNSIDPEYADWAGGMENAVRKAHRGGVNYLYCDGHVHWSKNIPSKDPNWRWWSGGMHLRP